MKFKKKKIEKKATTATKNRVLHFTAINDIHDGVYIYLFEEKKIKEKTRIIFNTSFSN